jgi:hypothetical protein
MPPLIPRLWGLPVFYRAIAVFYKIIVGRFRNKGARLLKFSIFKKPPHPACAYRLPFFLKALKLNYLNAETGKGFLHLPVIHGRYRIKGFGSDKTPVYAKGFCETFGKSRKVKKGIDVLGRQGRGVGTS